MKPEIAVAARQRVAALAVVVQSRGSGNEDLPAGFLGIVDALEQIPPSGVLVDLIQEQHRFPRWKLGAPDGRPDGRMIPVQVTGMGLIGTWAEETERESGLADLAWTADKHHLFLEGRSDRIFQIALDAHKVEYSPLYS